MAHKVFILFLFIVGLTAAVSVAVSGWTYYNTPLKLRAHLPEHKQWKPSGDIGHGLGIAGSSMVIIGIGMYSARKRIRALWNLGKLSTWLEVHMFLCLLGPVLVVYHTAFKAGGIAAISLWSMLSVMASGIIGRFLYVLIPRNVRGAELTTRQIDEEFDRQRAIFAQIEGGAQLLAFIDKSFASMKRPATLGETVRAYMHLSSLKRSVSHRLKSMLSGAHITRVQAHQVVRMAHARANLIQRSLLLLQVEKLFYYWHVIHLPFSGIMFVTLTVHVGIALWLGYTWVF